MQQVDLGDVLEFYGVQFRGNRREEKVLCPVHSDTNPSLNINLLKNVGKCHACGWAGSGLELIMAMEGIDRDASRGFAANHRFKAFDAEGSGAEISFGSVPRGGVVRRKGRKRGKSQYVPPWIV